MAEELTVELRDTRGKRNAKRMRLAGSVPAVLYGHGEENMALSVPGSVLDSLVIRGSRLVTLTGAVNESAFIREVQWDTWGTHVLHADFTRISEDEVVQVVVAIELRGEAPGVKDGGVIDQPVHELQVECPAGSIPEKLRVSINNLKMLESIKLGDLELPENVRPLSDPSTVVVSCIEPAKELEEEGDAVSGEPEVIGAKEEDTEASNDK